MTDEQRNAEMWRAVALFDLEVPARRAKTYFTKAHEWVSHIPVHRWEGLRRQGATAIGLTEYRAALLAFMTDPPSEGSARVEKRGWRPIAQINQLLQALENAGALPVWVAEIRGELPPDAVDEILQAASLRQAREFLLVLVTLIKTEEANQ
jgi:hypothetical protein